MGRQISIRSAPADRRRFEDRVEELGGVLLTNTSGSAAPAVVPRTEGVVQNFSGCFWVCLAGELEEVALRQVDTMGYWMVDQITAPVIEYTFRQLDGDGVGEGRLYYATGHYLLDEWVPRSEVFMGFADSLFKWVRREFSRPSKSGPYVGPAAECRQAD